MKTNSLVGSRSTILFAYLVFLTGILAMVTRLHPRLHWLHFWMGRAYIMSMFWGTATSLLIHNTGLPIGVMWSFLWVLCGLCVGYVAIGLVQHHGARFVKEEDENASRWKIIVGRMLSLKALHGCTMFTSWINIAGRIFVTPVADFKFECYTYAAYKQVPNSQHFNYTVGDPVKYVPQTTSDYDKMPWAYRETQWGAMLSLGPLFMAFIVSPSCSPFRTFHSKSIFFA
jgi:hypothetical protein